MRGRLDYDADVPLLITGPGGAVLQPFRNWK